MTGKRRKIVTDVLVGAELLFFAAGVALGDSLAYPDPGCEDERSESGCLKFANGGLGTRRACSFDACSGSGAASNTRKFKSD